MNNKYGQICPLAMASDFLCTRWTLLILRELILGSSSFNDISRGVPRMSRTLLSSRLKELTKLGIINKNSSQDSKHAKYLLTPAGLALKNVVFSMADWGQEWLEIEIELDKLECDHLIWSIHRTAQPHPVMPILFIVEIVFTDQPKKTQKSWLIFENDEVDICIIDRDFDVDVQILSTAVTLAKVWTGCSEFKQEVKSKALVIKGNPKYTSIADVWLGQSRIANIKKQPKELLVS
jgi:DNA-binding HxlR family transcriptional regulator